MRWEQEDCPPHRSRREEKESSEVTRVCVCWARGAHKSRGGGGKGLCIHVHVYTEVKEQPWLPFLSTIHLFILFLSHCLSRA